MYTPEVLDNYKINNIVYTAAVAVANGQKEKAVSVFNRLRGFAVTNFTQGFPTVIDKRVLYHAVKTVEHAIGRAFGTTQSDYMGQCESAIVMAQANVFNFIWKEYTRQTYIDLQEEGLI